jgi:hypothetical protein
MWKHTQYVKYFFVAVTPHFSVFGTVFYVQVSVNREMSLAMKKYEKRGKKMPLLIKSGIFFPLFVSKALISNSMQN